MKRKESSKRQTLFPNGAFDLEDGHIPVVALGLASSGKCADHLQALVQLLILWCL